MTRLFVNLICERCGTSYGVATGGYYGSLNGDLDIRKGLCLWCEMEDYFSKENKSSPAEDGEEK
ncbi:hypothetical protein [Thermicanus aegyptius]|uniref:hypothetical protein n=1 Tax=Thermicanus aegyptius TaxID=94009 RepID=UPI00041C23C9|nr:hypothetical protein [Thermicanus aegyptius]